MYRLQLDKRVTKTLDGLPVAVRQRIINALAGLRTNPRPAGCTKIRGDINSIRIRVGSYRVIYTVDESQQLITIWLIGHRKDVYRNL